MNAPVLAIIASQTNIGELMKAFIHLRYSLLFGSESQLTKSATLTLVCIEKIDFVVPQSPWLAWDQVGDPQIVLKAYQAGARAVFPKETIMDVLVEVTRRTVEELAQKRINSLAQRQRTYRRGELILLETDSVLSVEEGILATTMIHQDGSEVLLGLSGKGQIVVTHPDDNCHIQIVAHTASKVKIESWETAVDSPELTMKLKVRLQQMEGWAAMQARPSLSQRVLGILGLLAGQFGHAQDEGTRIDVRITHAQLASAVGSTRTSITRVLSELRDTGKIMIITEDGEDRYCLCDKYLAEYHRCG